MGAKGSLGILHMLSTYLINYLLFVQLLLKKSLKLTLIYKQVYTGHV